MGGEVDDEAQRCEQWKDGALKDSYVRFMSKAMSGAGCSITANYFRCVPCKEPVSGGLHFADNGDTSVVLCSNNLRSQDQTTTTAVHELIHAFDHCRAEMDPTNLVHQACTEIRAANLSGDCLFTREIARGHFNIARQHQICVKRRAIKSVEMNPSCPNTEAAAAAVDRAWDTCFADTAPFERIP